MAVQTFTYGGINRAVSDYSGASACEELINLRPTEGGLIPVKDFSVKFGNVNFDKIFVHHTTGGDKYIAIRRSTTAVQVLLVSGDPDDVSTSVLFEITGLSTDAAKQDVVDNLFFAAAGNVALFSIRAVDSGVLVNKAFTWKDGSYQTTEANDPGVTYTISSSVEMASATITKLTADASPVEMTESVNSGINEIQENNPSLCLGPIVIAAVLKTKDGRTFWTEGWKMYDPVPSVDADEDTLHVDSNTEWAYEDHYIDFFDKYGHGYTVTPNLFEYGGISQVWVQGAKVTLTFPKLAANAWNEETSIIQSVEVYASKPELYLDTSKASEGYYMGDVPGVGSDYASMILPQRKYEDMNLGGELLYHQASIPMASLALSSQTVNLTFGGNVQVTEETLDTDAGAVQRYGRVLSYNARFHYYDSVAEVGIEKPFFLTTPTGNTGAVYLLVRYADAERSELVYLGLTPSTFDWGQPADFVIAGSINIKEVIVYIQTGGHYESHVYRMEASSSYNYATGGIRTCKHTVTSTDVAEYRAAINAGAKTGITSVERAAINVTEQYNPFVFRVEHSYLAPGNVIDVQPQMAGLTDTSYGRDPLNVFTERGLYALTQGSANVLYGAFLPVSNLVAQRGGVPCEMGTFFLADGSLWLVSGRRVTLISDALSAGPHKYVRACPGYKKLSGTDTPYSPTPAPANPVYDVSPYLSQVEFEVFSRGGRLSYNRFRMELLVANPAYDYTYVLSLKHRQWFKLSRRIWQDEPGSVIANTPYGTSALNIVDLSTEDPGTILAHMQSRPFSFGYQYSHVHRVVSLIRARLSGLADEVATVALYGSENLQDWTLLACAKRSGNVSGTTDLPLTISQIRTSSAARSWRYYTLCIGGRIYAGGDFQTDIGPFLVDYNPVIRRIG